MSDCGEGGGGEEQDILRGEQDILGSCCAATDRFRNVTDASSTMPSSGRGGWEREGEA